MKKMFLASVVALTFLTAWTPWESFSPTPKPYNLCLRSCAITQDGIDLIKRFEGFSPYPYKDSAGFDTIGFGHLIKPGETFDGPLLGKAADDLLRKDVGFAESAVNRYTSTHLRPYQFDALTSFTFNLGAGAYQSSTLRKRVNADKHDQVPDEFMRWVYVTHNGQKKKIRGLERRRSAEASYYVDDLGIFDPLF